MDMALEMPNCARLLRSSFRWQIKLQGRWNHEMPRPPRLSFFLSFNDIRWFAYGRRLNLVDNKSVEDNTNLEEDSDEAGVFNERGLGCSNPNYSNFDRSGSWITIRQSVRPDLISNRGYSTVDNALINNPDVIVLRLGGASTYS